MRDLGRWIGGVTPSKSNSAYWGNGDVPWLTPLDISDENSRGIRGRVTELALRETSLRVVPAPSVAVVMRSNILRRRLPIGLVTEPTTVNQDIRALIPAEGISAEYVYQALEADSERIRSNCVRTDGSMAAVDSKGLFSWPISIPPMRVQLEIAKALGKVDSLVSDLRIRLPTEIVARRKQYQYYRNRLFAFEEAA